MRINFDKYLIVTTSNCF